MNKTKKEIYTSPTAEAVLLSSNDVMTSSGGSGGSTGGGHIGEWDVQ